MDTVYCSVLSEIEKSKRRDSLVRWTWMDTVACFDAGHWLVHHIRCQIFDVRIVRTGSVSSISCRDLGGVGGGGCVGRRCRRWTQTEYTMESYNVFTHVCEVNSIRTHVRWLVSHMRMLPLMTRWFARVGVCGSHSRVELIVKANVRWWGKRLPLVGRTGDGDEDAVYSYLSSAQWGWL